MKTKKPRKPKKRATPAFDAAVYIIRRIYEGAKEDAWSHKKLRIHLRECRHACRPVWRRAIKHVIGKAANELPDLRQLSLGRASNEAA